ncbi:hypothetical protein M0804_004171 [Polistes exclamans]|nr:hypothetical protein M0804_004171 [Polistes exclamans]
MEKELEIVKRKLELARTLRQSNVSMQDEPAMQSPNAQVGVKTIAELLSFFDGKAEDFPGWKKQVIALRTTYRLNDDVARILIGMRLRSKALEWMHSRPEFLETNLNDLMERFESMFYHRPLNSENMEGTASARNKCGRETSTTAVFGGGRSGHPLSTASNCQESGVGDLALTLVGATGSVSRVGDLVRGASNATKKEKKEMRTAGTGQGTQKGKSPKGYSTAWVRRAKRGGEKVDHGGTLAYWNRNRETDRDGKDSTLEAETERKRYGNIKGNVSGHMKRCHNDVLQIVRVLGDRLGTVGKDSVPDAVAQLRAENKLIMERKKFLTEEVARLKREMKRRDVPPGISAPAESVSAVSAAIASASGVIKVGNTVNKLRQRSVGEERLAAAREEENMDLRAIANLIRSLARFK